MTRRPVVGRELAPSAGLSFAAAMLVGIAFTLAAVAVAAVLAREAVVSVLARHGGSLARASRVLDAVSGGLLLMLGAYELAGLLGGPASPLAGKT